MALSRRAFTTLTGAVVAGTAAACGNRRAPGRGGAARAAATRRPLPPPTLRGGSSFEEVLARRRSVRAFADRPLTERQLAQVLWAGQGVTSPKGLRTAPSAGALYPLDLYAATRTDLLHYLPDGHAVERWEPTADWSDLVAATPSGDAVHQAAAVLVVAGTVRRTAVKYGGRSPVYVHLEAGHCAQNLVLQAVSLGLGAVTIGAFAADRLARFFALRVEETPFYLIPVGHPA